MWLTDLDEIWYSDAVCHADDDELVKIETGSRTIIWGRPFLEIGSSSNSDVD